MSAATLQRSLVLAAVHFRTWFGVAGAMGVLLVALGIGAVAWAPRLADDAADLRALARAESVRLKEATASGQRDPVAQAREFRDAFPEATQHLADLGTIFRLAREQKLQLARGDYATAKRVDAGLAAHDIVLPVRTNYAALRGFVAAVLNAMPHASLVELRLERAGGDQLNARVHLTLYYRES